MRLAVVALLVLAGVLPARAEAKWIEVRSANFLFVGDAPEGQIRDIARKLELFREVMLRALPGAASGSPVPTVVIVCATARTLQPVRPLFRGNPIELAGFFQSGEDVNYMVINAEITDAALPTVFHEYSHALVSNTLGPLPVWASEGLAEVYETMEQQRGGRSALLGRAQAYHLALLNRSTLIPIRDLAAVDHRSAMYNEGTRRGVLYAQSWALVHYLTFGNPERTKQFRQFLSAVRAGSDPRTVFADAFGADTVLDRELFDYVRRFSFPAMRFDFEDRVAGGAVDRGRTIEDLDAEIYIADLQSRLGRGDEARARLAAVLQKKPDAPRALVSQGMEHLRGGRLDAALPLLERAAALAPGDAWAQSAFGRVLIARLGNRLFDDAVTAALQQSRTVLARAVELDPDSAFAAAMLGYVEMTLGTDLPRAMSLLERAVRLAPSREEYHLFLAQSLIRQGNFAGATGVLGPLVAGAHLDEVRRRAKALLSNLAEQRNRAAPSPASAPLAATDLRELAGVTQSEALTVAEPPPSVTDPARPERSEQLAAPGADDTPLPVGLVLRPLGAGETRVLGQFRAIECAGGSVVLLVDGDSGPLRLRTKDIDDVDFISYRADGLSNVNCGVLAAPQRVLATYRAAPEGTGPGATAGDAVAIELLPDDYMPK
jgi:tetratricopeptide (TPR) repeat protein